MDRVINIKVRGNYLTKDKNIAGVRGEANATSLRITFDDGWDGYATKVTFWDAAGENHVVINLAVPLYDELLEGINTYVIAIPAEAMTQAGMMTFVIDGYIDGKRQRSVSTELEVKDAPFVEKADGSSEVTPTQAETIQLQINALLGNMQAEAITANTAKEGAVEAKTEAVEAAEAAEAAKAAAEEYAHNAGDSMLNARLARSLAQKAQEAAEAARNEAVEAKETTKASETAAVAAKNAIENMSVSAEQFSASEQPTVSKTEQNGVVNLHFGIPKGDKGDKGDKGEPFTYEDFTEEQLNDLAERINIPPDKVVKSGEVITVVEDTTTDTVTFTKNSVIQSNEILSEMLSSAKVTNLTPAPSSNGFRLYTLYFSDGTSKNFYLDDLDNGVKPSAIDIVGKTIERCVITSTKNTVTTTLFDSETSQGTFSIDIEFTSVSSGTYLKLNIENDEDNPVYIDVSELKGGGGSDYGVLSEADIDDAIKAAEDNLNQQ